jgi:glucokinase
MDGLWIGIDIGGTNLRFALVDSSGRILQRLRSASDIARGRDHFCRRLLEGVDELRSVAGAERVAAIGAGVPGLVGCDGTIRSSVNMRPLEGLNLAAFLEKWTGLPAVCGNDANLIAQGEYHFGAGRGLGSVVVITIGTGLGSGLILDGRLWTGASGFAAEFGHVTVDPEGLPCPCGNRGCLEQYVSAPALVRTARGLLSAEQLGGLGQPLDARLVAALARSGNSAALAAFAGAGSRLGIALASLANTLNLEAAIIGGGVAASLDLLLPSLLGEFRQRCFPEIAAPFSVFGGALGDDAGILGGVALAKSRLQAR